MPIYDNLEDHDSVYERAPVPGMGNVNTFFFTHKVSLLHCSVQILRARNPVKMLRSTPARPERPMIARCLR